MTSHTGQVVFVTGAASGPGRAVALTFARRGADLIIGDNVSADRPRVPRRAGMRVTEAFVHEAGARCLSVDVDVRSQATLDAAVLAGLDAYGHIDVGIANTAATHVQPFADIDDRAWSRVIDVSLSGVWRLAKAVTPHMVQRRSGVFLAVGSSSGHTARREHAACTAAEHGLLGLMRTLALELSPFDVRVNTVLSHVEPSSALPAAWGIGSDRGVVSDTDRATAETLCWLASDAAGHLTSMELPLPLQAGGVPATPVSR